MRTYSPRGSRSAYWAAAAERVVRCIFLVQLGQLPAEGTGAVAQLRQQCGQRLPQAVRRFIKNEGMRQAGDSLQGSLPLSFFDGQKALKQKPPGG